MVNDALLWLFVTFSGIAAGAGLYEMRINVPRWFPRAGPAIGCAVEAIRQDDSGRRFWALVTTGPLTLLTVASCVAAWSPDTPRDWWWLVGAGVLLIERVGTFGYFIPQLLKLLKTDGIPDARAAQAARTWTRLNRLRIVLAISGWLAALRALSLPG